MALTQGRQAALMWAAVASILSDTPGKSIYDVSQYKMFSF